MSPRPRKRWWVREDYLRDYKPDYIPEEKHVEVRMASDVPELMGAAEAAQELGVKSSNLRKTKGLPVPVQQLKAGPLWLASDIRALAKGRPSAALAKARRG